MPAEGENMPASPMNLIVQNLRNAALQWDGSGLSDGELLGCFIERRDEAALTALVKRHGPMVWSVCRRLLNYHDAEDAFQATFIVLVRKAASVAPREMVGNWLYGVANQAALQARRAIARRRTKEVQVAEMPDTQVSQEIQWDELEPLLDQELSHLPANYRAVIVLCDLESRTRKEVARQLGVPEGTVAGRLARARLMLAKRLAQRGVVLSSTALAMLLMQGVATASVPRTVMSSTINAATLCAAGQAATAGVLSVKVAAITEGVLKAMLMSKLKTATAALLVVVALCGAIGLNVRTQAGEQPGQKKIEDGKDQKPKTDKERLQGKWQLVSQVRNGEEWKLKGDEADVIELIVAGDSMRLRNVTTYNLDPANPQLSTTYARYRLDTTAKLKSFDEVECSVEELFDLAELDKKFDNPDERYLGVYSLEEDTLTLCFSMFKGTKMRPTAFESKAGSNVMLQIFKRAAGQAK
jgi:RNA polymerase sigma factor (sigma-70 family)